MISSIEDERWNFTTDLVPVESTLIQGMRYDPTHYLLEIVFRNGGVYQYIAVPPNVYERLANARSKGTFFGIHIRNIYPYWRLHRLTRRKKSV